jgi:hypothetical protein
MIGTHQLDLFGFYNSRIQLCRMDTMVLFEENTMYLQ